MRQIQKYILPALLTLISLPAVAQELNSAYFTSDFKYRHDLNPAMGNEQSYVAMPGIGNFNVKMMGNFGYEDIIYKNPLYPAQSAKKNTTFMNPYLNNPLDGFNKGINKVNAQVSIALLSTGFKAFGGYNTIELNARAMFYGKIPYELFDFAANTGNKNYDIGDINFMAQSFTELAFNHSHQITKKLRVGAKLKF